MTAGDQSRRHRPRASRRSPVSKAVRTGTRRRRIARVPGCSIFPAWEGYGSIFEAQESEYQPGRLFLGGSPGNALPGAPQIPGVSRGPINNWTEAAGTGAVLAIDPATGDERWRFDMTDVTSSGILDHDAGRPLHRQSRRLLPRPRRAERRSALAQDAGRDDRQRPDFICSRRPAVRCRRRRQRPLRVRTARVRNTPRGL